MLANLAIIITSEESPAFNAWLTWKDLLHLVDIVCCCAVLFPVRACCVQRWLGSSLPAAASVPLSVYTLWLSSSHSAVQLSSAHTVSTAD